MLRRTLIYVHLFILMMWVYRYHNYPQNKQGLELDIEEFFLAKKATGLYLALPVGSLPDRELVAVNYGAWPNEPVKAVQQGDAAWFVDAVKKTFTKIQNRYVLAGEDRLRDRYVLEGTIETIFAALKKKKYARIDPPLDL